MNLVRPKFGVWSRRNGHWIEAAENIRLRSVKVGWAWVISGSKNVVAGPYLAKANLKRGHAAANTAAFIAKCLHKTEASLVEALAEHPVTQVRFSMSRNHVFFSVEGLTQEFRLYGYSRVPQELLGQTFDFTKPVYFKEINGDHIKMSNNKKFKLDQRYRHYALAFT